MHIAFLTPFGNAPGYTVLVPRKHLGSDYFRLQGEDCTAIGQAAYTVAQILNSTFEIGRCGMFFEGYEIDYAHFKLVLVHQGYLDGKPCAPILGSAPFHQTYKGYLITQSGRLAHDLDVVSAQTVEGTTCQSDLSDYTYLRLRSKPARTRHGPCAVIDTSLYGILKTLFAK